MNRLVSETNACKSDLLRLKAFPGLGTHQVRLVHDDVSGGWEHETFGSSSPFGLSSEVYFYRLRELTNIFFAIEQCNVHENVAIEGLKIKDQRKNTWSWPTKILMYGPKQVSAGQLTLFIHTYPWSTRSFTFCSAGNLHYTEYLSTTVCVPSNTDSQPKKISYCSLLCTKW